MFKSAYIRFFDLQQRTRMPSSIVYISVLGFFSLRVGVGVRFQPRTVKQRNLKEGLTTKLSDCVAFELSPLSPSLPCRLMLPQQRARILPTSETCTPMLKLITWPRSAYWWCQILLSSELSFLLQLQPPFLSFLKLFPENSQSSVMWWSWCSFDVLWPTA